MAGVPAAAAAVRPARRGVLWALLFGNFVIGTGVMTVPGTLNEISASLAVPVAVAGQLISTGALVMCFGAPLFAALLGGRDRRALLALAMAWFALLHAACALAPGFAWLLPLRVLALVPCAIFTPQAAASVGLLVPVEQRGRAIAFIFLGWSLASVLGMPLAAFVGGALGWRHAMGAVAILGLASAAWVWRALAALVCIPWALGCFASNSAQQARVVSLAPALASGSVALNSSAIYAGQAIGTGIGGWMIAQAGMDRLHWAGLAGMVAAMAASALATRYARRAA